MVAGEGQGPVAAGGALPFTGIEDVFLPLLLGALILLAGVIAYRFAAVRDALSRVAHAAGVRKPVTAYLDHMVADKRTAEIWSGDRAADAA